MKFFLCLLLVCGLLLQACATAYYGQEATIPPTPCGCPAPTAEPTDSQMFFAVCVSGGGTRAMTMGWEVIEHLRQVKYQNHTLVSEIDYVSGVSGGSFVAAALPIYGFSGWQEFYDRAVAKNIQRALIWRMCWPTNWVRLASPYFTRTDLAAEYYHRNIFKRRVFCELPTTPILKINSTLLARGVHFVFDSAGFSYINSDYNHYRVGSACAASSAFPGGFSPITIRNYTPYYSEAERLANDRYRAATRNAQYDTDLYQYYQLYRFLTDTTNRWVHLSDGGIAGNTGIERVLEEWKTNGLINKLTNGQKPLKRLVILAINAGTEKADSSCVQQEPPDLLHVVLYTTTTAMDVLSAKMFDMLQNQADNLWGYAKRVREMGISDPALSQLEKPYIIEVNARNLNNEKLKADFDRLPTSFGLKEKQRLLIRQVVDTLLTNNSEYQRLLQSVNQ